MAWGGGGGGGGGGTFTLGGVCLVVTYFNIDFKLCFFICYRKGLEKTGKAPAVQSEGGKDTERMKGVPSETNTQEDQGHHRRIALDTKSLKRGPQVQGTDPEVQRKDPDVLETDPEVQRKDPDVLETDPEVQRKDPDVLEIDPEVQGTNLKVQGSDQEVPKKERDIGKRIELGKGVIGIGQKEEKDKV